jgi:PAS domain S-box-containing protein
MKLNKDAYRRIVKAIPEGIWVVSPQGQTIFCSERMARILGTDVESMEKMSCFDPVFPEDLAEAQRQFELQMAGGPSFDFRLRRKDGSAVWVNIACRPMHDEAGVVVWLLGLFTDISGRIRGEAMLRESEERFRSMADTAPAMIWIAGPDKLGTFVNKSWLNFTGRTMEQELGTGWAENIHPADKDRCSETYESSFDARLSLKMEYRLRRADGEYRWVLDNGVPRFEADGRFSGYIGSCIDITDLKRAQEIDLARQKLETLGSMAGGFVHDFGNLLAGIMAYAEVVLDALERGSVPVAEVKSIRDEAMHGAEIARQLMVYAGQEDETRDLVNVSGIVEDMVELLKMSVSKHVVVETQLDKRIRLLRASSTQIRQIVMNLIANASEAIGDRDGVIRLTTQQVTVDPKSHSAASGDLAASHGLTAGEYVQLEVSDTGRGMTPEVQARIFEMFFTTKVSGIHGLGLTAVQGIVEHLGGMIHVSSEPGKGTTFQIILPCKEAALGVPAPGEDKTSPSRGATVLLVEDDRMLRQALSTMLRMKDFTILEASDGSVALDAIRSHRKEIDVVLLDISLPGAPSYEVYEEASRQTPALPVIVTSAYNKRTAAATLGTTVDRFLRKPFKVQELIEMIQEISTSKREGHVK